MGVYTKRPIPIPTAIAIMPPNAAETADLSVCAMPTVYQRLAIGSND